MDVNYSVTIESFAESHYIKSFQKKYKGAWDITRRAVVAEFERIEMLLQTEKAEVISNTDDIRIIKTKFKVAGTKESAKTSGDRCIILADDKRRTVSVLLVYTKTDLPSTNETAEWKNIIKDNYPELKKYF